MKTYEEERPRLFALAYRMLGSAADAEDVVQEAFATLHRTGATPDSPAAWLTTVLTRLCLDRAGSAARRREVYVGPCLPEPIPTPDLPDAIEPGDRLSTAESVSIAFLLVLERLSPLERAVFLLREAFDADFAEIAASLGRSEAACRQLLHRAKERVAAGRPRFTPARESHKALVLEFLQASRSGDVDGLKRLLSEDVELVGDGGGKVTAARNVLVGTERVARFLAGVAERAAGLSYAIGWVNGELAFTLRDEAGVIAVTVLSLAPSGDRIARIQSVLNPDKLRSFGSIGEGSIA
ncbi:RNA polymerase sigma factor SigJ [Vulgatibacter sp.]|uniref:RNA polymerase sigma factor SigJ n=1 Tax=Vulgatibacter sp. TaxID=1971226 RepID=UPI00356887BE